jgi:outer membrane receptor protein involved in Fe transport
MVKGRLSGRLLALMLFLFGIAASAQQAGSIRGMVYDKDFDAPLANARILIAETGETGDASDEGNFIFGQVPPGAYTLVFSKDGYAREVKTNVVVSSGRMTELDAWLSGEFTEMEEFIVQDIQIGGGAEAALLELRFESPALMDSISADLMSQAGAGDAASALRLVSGATVQDGKYAVVRGLPDRYVNSQMNAIRLPTADADKRAVQLDQFPSAAIESIQVSKTFTPDQQGDASGGAVNVVLKGIPDETVFKIGGSTSYNNRYTGDDDFLKYDGGHISYWGKADRDIPFDGMFEGPVGVSRGDAPTDYKWSVATGGKHEFDFGLRIGGFGSLFHERDSSFYADGVDDKYWVLKPGEPMTPQFSRGSPEQGEFLTSLYDVTQGSREIKWGGLGAVGIETDNHSLTFAYLLTRSTEDAATLAEDTRGKAHYFPGYDPDDNMHPGNQARDAAPYLRLETLQYTERETETMQLAGRHKLPDPEFLANPYFSPLGPEFDWSLSNSISKLDQPDKRQFASFWWAERFRMGNPRRGVPDFIEPEVHRPLKPASNFTLGNVQRIWKDISEESDQYSVNLKFPFEQWTASEGYLKFGVFNDQVHREYNQDSFSNFNDNSAQFFGPWEEFWSAEFPDEIHPITAADIDVDYTGDQRIHAWYYMADLPLTSWFNVIGGARYEDTELTIVNTPEKEVRWVPPGSAGPVRLNPGDADVAFEQNDILPSIGFKLTPLEQITLRGSYSETVARQTFKELTPIQQQEFLGGDVFIGNPALRMSALKNYDLRLDYTPYDGGLVSLSYFYKNIQDPIEYVQRIIEFPYATPLNFPEGRLKGWEVELRQKLEHVWSPLGGLSVGANATFIDSEVTLPEEESAQFEEPNIRTPIKKRDMTNAPEYLYNLFMTYELDNLGLVGTQVSAFYTVRGDTLIAGAGQSNGKFVPDVYEKEYGALNLSLSQKIGEAWKVQLQAKNLLDPEIETIYRSKYIGEDVTKTSHQKGREFSIGISGTF